ncbi:MAG TPA: hypothetical protein VFD13_02275 [Candidatus Kapabacteria bacterium]|nr:hypothetical protein [Candidatus Kapabacteria bacterium]
MHNTLLLAAVVAPMLARAQSLKPGEWRTYTSMRSVTDVALASDSVHTWAATGGGAFEVDLRNVQAAPIALRTTDGLSENDLTAVAADAQGNIYFGGGNGGFDVYHTASGTIDQLGNDISTSTLTIKTINSITVYGNKIYLATAYGISEFLPQRGAFGATATQLAGLQTEDSVRQVLDDGTHVYAAMHEGVVFTTSAADLQNWSLLPDSGGSVRALANFHGTIYAGAENGLFAVSLAQGSLVPIAIPFSIAINRMIVAKDSLYILDETGTIYSTHDLAHFAVQSLSPAAGSTITAIAPDPVSGIALGTLVNGMAFSIADSLYTNLFPTGPITNSTSFLSFATATGQLYVTNLDAGFDVFQPVSGVWQDFQSGVGTTPKATYITVLYDSIRGSTWFTTLGTPFYRAQDISSSSPVWDTISHAGNGIPVNAGNSGEFIISGGMMIDADGNFVVTTWAGNEQGLSVSSDGVHFQNYSLAPLSAGFQPWGPVTQDQYGNYWVGTEEHNEPPSTGVYWLRKSDRLYGIIRGGSSGTLGTPIDGTERVNAILTDQDDGIWCGTEGGVEIISNPEAINNQSPVFYIRSVPFLVGQVVRTMAVDGVGNKWIGTDNGIFVVSPDGADSVARFTKENSPLIDDHVTSIAIDPTRGEAYAGTAFGISRFSTIFTQGQPDYSNIRVYPNPAVQTAEVGGSPTVYIAGLVAGSTVQIFSLAGKLITTINGTALGSTVTWNGRDALGRQVPSGMYLASATSAQSAGENGEAKVVIVRKP